MATIDDMAFPPVEIYSGDTPIELYQRTSPIRGWLRSCLEGPHAPSEGNTTSWFVAVSTPRESLSISAPYERRIFVMGEPSPMVDIDRSFLNQFGNLVSPFRVDGYDGNWIERHPALPWFYGWDRHRDSILTFSELQGRGLTEKTGEISVVLSNKTTHAGHRFRLQLVERLREALGDRLTIFGRGIRPIDDKAEAIGPFKYHLVLENTCEPNYWSEKLADAYLGNAFPIYLGCPNIHQWFGSDAMVVLARHESSGEECLARMVERVLDVLKADPYAERVPHIQQARKSILMDHSFGQMIWNIVTEAKSTKSHTPAPSRYSLLPPKPIPWTKKLIREVRRVFHKMMAPM